MLLDKGGAEVSRCVPEGGILGEKDPSFSDAREDCFFTTIGGKMAQPYVMVKVRETHDEQECGCIEVDEQMLNIGDTITLHHTCVDGRVDKVEATVIKIYGGKPTPEHTTVSVEKPSTIFTKCDRCGDHGTYNQYHGEIRCSIHQ